MDPKAECHNMEQARIQGHGGYVKPSGDSDVEMVADSSDSSDSEQEQLPINSYETTQYQPFDAHFAE